ncbi:hypothetical protein COS64_02405 [archaeon CG06_land_8_20_14_3_00_37_11]|nr:MAG: hypothetical protein COS64_02405 [archaeon CG06_land_8_20_14_3_00_37_11]
MINYVLLLLLSYFIGSFPTAYLFDRNIFRKGSGNMGAFNYLMTNKSLPGTLIVAVIDALKGVLIVLLSNYLVGTNMAIIFGVIAGIIGHDYSAWIGFKGGRGLALACGALLLLEPLFLVMMSAVVLLFFFITKDNVKAGLISIPFLLVLAFVMNLPEYFLVMGLLSAVLISHKDVIILVKRLK